MFPKDFFFSAKVFELIHYNYMLYEETMKVVVLVIV